MRIEFTPEVEILAQLFACLKLNNKPFEDVNHHLVVMLESLTSASRQAHVKVQSYLAEGGVLKRAFPVITTIELSSYCGPDGRGEVNVVTQGGGEYHQEKFKYLVGGPVPSSLGEQIALWVLERHLALGPISPTPRKK